MKFKKLENIDMTLEQQNQKLVFLEKKKKTNNGLANIIKMKRGERKRREETHKRILGTREES